MKIKMLTVLTICCLAPVITGCATSSVSLLEDGTVNLTYEGLWIRGDAESAAKQVKSAMKKICEGFEKAPPDELVKEQKAGTALSQLLVADRSLQEAMVELQQATNTRELMIINNESGNAIKDNTELIEDLKNKVKERKAALEAATARFMSELIVETAEIADQIVKSVKNRTVVVVSSNCKLWSSSVEPASPPPDSASPPPDSGSPPPDSGSPPRDGTIPE